MQLYRNVDPNEQIIEYRCVELTEEALYGRLTKNPQPPIPPEMTEAKDPMPTAPGSQN